MALFKSPVSRSGELYGEYGDIQAQISEREARIAELNGVIGKTTMDTYNGEFRRRIHRAEIREKTEELVPLERALLRNITAAQALVRDHPGIIKAALRMDREWEQHKPRVIPQTPLAEMQIEAKV